MNKIICLTVSSIFFISTIVLAGTVTSDELKAHDLASKKFYEEENGGPFSFEKQFARIASLRLQGKQVGLIIGRAITERHSPKEFEETETQSWAYLDLKYGYGEGPHFVMDACDLSTWEKFDDEMFSHVVFDFNVSDFVFDAAALEHNNQEALFKIFARILQKGGVLSIDAGGYTAGFNLAGIGGKVTRSSRANIVPTFVEVCDGKKHYQVEEQVAKYSKKLEEAKAGGTLTTNNFEAFAQLMESNPQAKENFGPWSQIALVAPSLVSIERGLQLDIDFNQKEKIRLEQLLAIKSAYLEFPEEEPISVVEHITKRIKSTGFSSVSTEKTRPWGRHDFLHSTTDVFFNAVK